MKRPVALSMFPDHKPDRPTGPLPLSVQFGTNADVIATVAPIYLTGSVLDVTFGRGGWWRRFTPDPFVVHDLIVDGVDFRDLPEADSSFDAVTFDPPYAPQGGIVEGTPLDFRDRYGLNIVAKESELWTDWIAPGLSEVVRVSNRFVLAKCCDYVSGGKFRVAHTRMIDLALAAGCKVHDVIVHAGGSGPGGHRTFEVLRARRAHSYLLVFEVPR